MRFEYYHHGLDDQPKLSVDGTVPNAIHFSHWSGNETPAEVKADTSTEIALNLVASPRRQQLTQGLELVTNNHFDTDGVLSVWTVLMGEKALELRDQLIGTAEAGDFSEFSNEDAVRASIVIQGADQVSPDDEDGSPLVRQLTGKAVAEAQAYELVLPQVERVLTRTNDFEDLWKEPWRRIVAAIESFERGTSTVEEYVGEKVSLITLAPEIFSSSGFNPTRHAAPYTAISRYAHGTIFLIATPVNDGWSYRIDYPYYSWAETVVRPRIQRRDLSEFLKHLNEREGNGDGEWKLDSAEMTSAAKFLRTDGLPAVSTLNPEVVGDNLRKISLTQSLRATI
jgi:uncharacterized protein DUF6687